MPATGASRIGGSPSPSAGNAASTVPRAIIPPPIHSHRTIGLMATLIVAVVSPACGLPFDVR